MSLHSYSRVWLHLVWATLERRPVISKTAAARLSGYLHDYASQKGVYMKLNYVNPDHVHALVDLPTSLSIEEMMHLFKGASSHWINENRLVLGRFGWGRGYGAFSVSHSAVPSTGKYLATQEEHHRKRSFAEEVQLLVQRHGLVWHDDKTVETVKESSGSARPPRSNGVLMRTAGSKVSRPSGISISQPRP